MQIHREKFLQPKDCQSRAKRADDHQTQHDAVALRLYLDSRKGHLRLKLSFAGNAFLTWRPALGLPHAQERPKVSERQRF